MGGNSVRTVASVQQKEITTSRAKLFRDELTAPSLSFIMEAHDGLSAKVVEQAGFRGIWASGLSISAALGLRDCNEASLTQVLDVLDFMTDATTIPAMLDGDTGYGNYNNFRLLVRKLSQRGIAAVCIEDKIFPKTNSFLGDFQPLADIDEYCGKIKAGNDAKLDDDFTIVARIEALIAGYGLDEALKRAEAYHAAEADAILIHSRSKQADEVLAFAREWANRSPLILVPTSYYMTPMDDFRKAEIAMVIWANHTLRASLRAMQEVCAQLHKEESLVNIEDRVASMKNLFAISGNDALKSEEERYLTSKTKDYRTIVLAAGRGDLGALTDEKPKCMLDVHGQPLLRRLVSTFNERGIRDIQIVRGYRKEAIDLPAIKTLDNDAYETTGEAYSLACAADALAGSCLVSFGDILFRGHVLDRIMEVPGDIVLAVDTLWAQRTSTPATSRADLAICSAPFTGEYLGTDEQQLVRLEQGTNPQDTHGRWIGLAKLSDAGCLAVRAELDAMRADGSLAQAAMADLFNRLVARGHTIKVCYITGLWLDVNDAADLASAQNFP